MKHKLFLFVCLLALAVSINCGTRRNVVRARPLPPPPRVEVDISIFYDSLAPYGRWFAVDDFGWAWTPYDVPVGWRPYTHGHWVWTDFGWTWVSSWRWGWAPFHYGRWVFHGRHGWIWLPGRIWGPAWVVWRHHPGRWVGWAPMPPQRGWRVGVEFDIWNDPDDRLEPHAYSFVEEREFTARNLADRIALPARNGTLLPQARNITDYRVTAGRALNRSLDVQDIERATGRAIPPRRVVDANAAGSEQVNGNEVRVYRPNMSRDMPQRTPPVSAPPRQPARSPDELNRREEQERRRLETEQARTRQVLTEQQRKEQTRVPRQLEAEQVRRQQEAERRALDDQARRERELLKNRQETRRQVEPPKPTAPPRKPTETKKEMPQRKPPGKP